MNYSRITLNPLTVVNNIFGASGKDLAYPSIIPFSSDNSDKSDRSDKSSEDSKSGDDEGKEHKRRVKSVGVRTDPTKEFGNDIYGPEV